MAGVTIAADEPIASEEFWRGALTSSERVRTGPSAPGGPRSRVHLDLACDPARFDAETQQFIALGAVRIGPSRREPYGRNQIFLDPEGLPFCLNAYNER